MAAQGRSAARWYYGCNDITVHPALRFARSDYPQRLPAAINGLLAQPRGELMRIDLAYGRNGLAVDLPDNWNVTVIEPLSPGWPNRPRFARRSTPCAAPLRARSSPLTGSASPSATSPGPRPTA
ncbi:MAG: hypothetical protein R3A10_22765 [Caldilineaceae bacterium]